MKKGIRPGTDKRNALMRFLMNYGLSNGQMLEIVLPMRGKPDEEKEQIAAQILEKLQAEYPPFKFYKENPGDSILWVDTTDRVGEFMFTFDKARIFHLFRDYPYKLTPEQKRIFDNENPYWRDYFTNQT